MSDIENIKDKISKLLALAGSSNEHEAHAALLKAREFMVKYKLREADVQPLHSLKVVDRLTHITCTKMTNAWATKLAAIIAENYCCKSYRNHVKRARKVTVGLVGLEDDIEICEKVLIYAFDYVVAECRQIRKKYRDTYVSVTIRQMENAYGHGFCDGVLQAYKDQNANHQEYGLVLVTPQAVMNVVDKMKNGGAYSKANYDSWRMQFAQQGYQAGKNFDLTTKLAANGG